MVDISKVSAGIGNKEGRLGEGCDLRGRFSPTYEEDTISKGRYLIFVMGYKRYRVYNIRYTI